MGKSEQNRFSEALIQRFSCAACCAETFADACQRSAGDSELDGKLGGIGAEFLRGAADPPADLIALLEAFRDQRDRQSRDDQALRDRLLAFARAHGHPHTQVGAR